MKSVETVANDIGQCRFEYGKINKLVLLVNKGFGMSLVIIMVQIIFTFTSIAYWFVDSFIRANEELHHNNIFSMVLIIVIVIINCQSAQNCIILVSFCRFSVI